MITQERRAVGLYRQLVKERADEERRCWGARSPAMRGLDSKVLVRGPGYAADLAMMHRLLTRGPRNAGEGMRLGSLMAKYRKEYGELSAEQQGQQELL
jgi:hypothetical protein